MFKILYFKFSSGDVIFKCSFKQRGDSSLHSFVYIE